MPSNANPLQIINRVRKSVRSIVDLDAKHQSQGTYIHKPPVYASHFPKLRISPSTILTQRAAPIHMSENPSLHSPRTNPLHSNRRLHSQSPDRLHFGNRHVLHRQYTSLRYRITAFEEEGG
jgi:hypothetical protein